MNYAASHVLYVDTRASRDLDGRYLTKPTPEPLGPASVRREGAPKDRTLDREIEDVRANIKALLSTFDGVHTCTSGESCMVKLSEFDCGGSFDKPIIAIVEIFMDDEEAVSVRDYSTVDAATSATTDVGGLNEREGLALLQHIVFEKKSAKLSKLVVPVAMIHHHKAPLSTGGRAHGGRLSRPSSGGLDKVSKSSHAGHKDSGAIGFAAMEPHKMFKCLESGATDVLLSPLSEARLSSLPLHAYSAHMEVAKEKAALHASKRLRKRSWVGFDDKRPHAYLREQMVSGLMTGICDPENFPYSFDIQSLPALEPTRESSIASSIGSWAFSAHEFSDDELVHIAALMLQHALDMPELEKWRIPAVDLKIFLLASRAAYNAFVYYHNFRHVVDVMQAVFYFLIQIGTLPPYPPTPASAGHNEVSPIAALLRPFDALTLLISAIGHDVGHPGVNNAFLVALNAPLAQLYNDRSVLESFHCAAYSQILRRYWKHAFEDTAMRGLLISSILATDMGLHFNYMTELGNLQQKVHDNGGTDGWKTTILEEYRTLTCGLLIKCADISNVARPFTVAAQWADLLQQEFANQGIMEKDVGIKSTLFGGPPEIGNTAKLANSQNGFMNMFARPLFEAVTDILPTMVFAVDEMDANTKVWNDKIEQEKEKVSGKDEAKATDDYLSPRSGTPNPPLADEERDRSFSQPELSHPEGLPASGSPIHPTLSASMQHLDDSIRRTSIDRTQELRENPDRSSSPFRESRRSSFSPTAGYMGSAPEQPSFSRRSSGAFSAAQHPSYSTRRSSNTSPSQLQLAAAPDARQPVSAENVQPSARGSEDTLSQPGKEPNRGSVGSGGGDVTHRGNKNGEGYRPARLSNNASSARFSTHSNHQRDSSGAHTSMSQSIPYSPTGTQATSILTSNSDERRSSQRNGSTAEGAGWSSSPSMRSKSIPDVVDMERLGSGQSADSGADSHKIGEVKTSIFANGNISPNEERERVVNRKNSRFRLGNLFRKKGRMEASP